eukprot:4292810-Prymnesium_polylepis.1
METRPGDAQRIQRRAKDEVMRRRACVARGAPLWRARPCCEGVGMAAAAVTLLHRAMRTARTLVGPPTRGG